MARAPRKPKPETAAADEKSAPAATKTIPVPDEPEELEGVDFVLISPVRMGGRREIGETLFLIREEHLALRKAGAVAEDWPEES